MKFRWHRSTLAESMTTVVEIQTKADLVKIIADVFAEFGAVSDDDVVVEPYGFDKRMNWHSHIVTVKGLGPVGFTDGPLP